MHLVKISLVIAAAWVAISLAVSVGLSLVLQARRRRPAQEVGDELWPAAAGQRLTSAHAPEPAERPAS